MRIAVLISGSGTNLQAIIDAVSSKNLQNIEIAAVIADRDCFGIAHYIGNYKGAALWLPPNDEPDVEALLGLLKEGKTYLQKFMKFVIKNTLI